MKRILGVAAAMALAVGCRGPSQVYDPFLGRTTVDPPGTATPPPGQPYYGAPPMTTAPATSIAPPAGATAPLPRYGSPNFSPTPAGGAGMSSSFTPNVSPTQPTSAPPGRAAPPPMTPVSNPTRPSYLPPGGSAYPQAQTTPGAQTPTLAQPAGYSAVAQANPPAALDVDRILASQNSTAAATTSPGAASTSGARSAGGASANAATPVAFTAPGSTIRIVEPSAATTPVGRSADVGNATAGSPLAASSGAAPGLFHAAGPTSAIMPAGATSSGTLNQSLSSIAATGSSSPSTPTRIPEITELPKAGADFSSAAGGSSPSAANRTASQTTSSAEGASSGYAYDAQYHALKGKLEYSQSAKQWRIRYIPADGATDNYGGSVIMADASKLNGLKDGDFVAVQGAPGAASATAGSYAPLYNVDHIQKL